MILEVPEFEPNILEQMQGILKKLPDTHPKYKRIESDMRKLASGNAGENNIAYHIKFWFGNNHNVIGVHNLTLEQDGRKAQIDYILAVPAGFLVIESKSITQHIRIDNLGNWVKTDAKGTAQNKGMYNPVEQNRRHIAVLKDLSNKICNSETTIPFGNVIVLSNPDTIIEGYKPSKQYSVLKIDQLRNFIERCLQRPAVPSQPGPLELIQQFTQYHIPSQCNLMERYGLDYRDLLPLNERVSFDIESKSIKCTFCDARMILKKRKDNLFWGCSNYPSCKNIVPAQIVALVSKDRINKHEKDKSFLSSLFSNPIRTCPVCGSSLIIKENRKEKYHSCPNATLCKYYREK
ncbi:NERD domain-containing protein [Heliobacterium chlorum]|uniref:NERD domain-containing protein n=1 Tax=Heliobacterium chlorum TaxID=2698 RepID=A0ABR7T3J0_HELCL|nr:nuclease-related domain-containing protein [Heliobacterium chlorum]MBC9785338.1 NERD domain-containing protein [Heliobacterium chlorum]